MHIGLVSSDPDARITKKITYYCPALHNMSCVDLSNCLNN